VSLSVEQLKAARKLLGWSRSELSHKSDVEYGRIENFELGLRTLSPDADAALMRTFEAAGIEFDGRVQSSVRLSGASFFRET
jgi:transcriptional regulator with XRE-family HTH domain